LAAVVFAGLAGAALRAAAAGVALAGAAFAAAVFAADGLAAAFFVVDYDIARWHLYVLTDSLYISLVVIVTWAAHRAVGRGVSAYLAASGALLLIALIRPNGWIMVPIVAIYWIARSTMHRTARIASTAAVAIVCGGSAAAFAAIQFGRETPSRRELMARGQLNRQRLPFARVMTIRERLDPAMMPVRLFDELWHIQPGFSLRHKIMVVAMLAGSLSTAVQPHASEQVVFPAIGTFTSWLHPTEPWGCWIWC